MWFSKLPWCLWTACSDITWRWERAEKHLWEKGDMLALKCCLYAVSVPCMCDLCCCFLWRRQRAVQWMLDCCGRRDPCGLLTHTKWRWPVTNVRTFCSATRIIFRLLRAGSYTTICLVCKLFRCSLWNVPLDKSICFSDLCVKSLPESCPRELYNASVKTSSLLY